MNRILLGTAALVLIISTAKAAEVLNREHLQQQRIAQGVGSGQLTARETGHLEHREATIDASRRADLRAHGGHLTAAEHANLNARENSVSAQIYDEKHNLRTQPGVAPQ